SCVRGWFFFFSSRRRHTRFSRDWSSDVCSSDLAIPKSDSTDFGTDGSYKVCVKLVDAATNDTYGASSAFTLDTEAPTVDVGSGRSEERRVGRECRSGGWRQDDNAYMMGRVKDDK